MFFTANRAGERFAKQRYVFSKQINAFRLKMFRYRKKSATSEFQTLAFAFSSLSHLREKELRAVCGGLCERRKWRACGISKYLRNCRFGI